jgi:hypothetical protein
MKQETYDEKFSQAESELRKIIAAYTDHTGQCKLDDITLRQHAWIEAGNAFYPRMYVWDIADKLMKKIKENE